MQKLKPRIFNRLPTQGYNRNSEDKGAVPIHSHSNCQGPPWVSPCLPSSQDAGFPHSLKMTEDKAGLLLLSSPDKVTIGLLFWDGPGQGLRLLLRDTDRFSSHVGGTLGMLPMALHSEHPQKSPLPSNKQCPEFLFVSQLPCLYPLLIYPLSLRPVLPGCALGAPNRGR